MKNNANHNDKSPQLRGKPLSVHELAELLDVTNVHIREMIGDGMPVFNRGGKGKSHILSSADCLDWIIQRKSSANPRGRPKDTDENSPKARIDAIKVERAELDLDEKRGDLIHAADIGPFIDDKLTIFRMALVQLSERYREEFPAEPPPINVAARWIGNEVTGILNELASGLKNVAQRDA